MSTMTMPEVTESPAERLETTCAAVRLSFTWFGCSKSLTPSQRAVVAGAFGATERVLSAGKKLLDTHASRLCRIDWNSASGSRCLARNDTPLHRAGNRLIRRSQIALLDGRLKELREDLPRRPAIGCPLRGAPPLGSRAAGDPL